MKETELYRQVMQGMDVQAAAAAFWANNPPSSVPSSIRQSVAQSLQVSRNRIPRPPRPSSSITPSEHRPHVLASDRLLVWSTPAGQEWQTELEKNFPDASLFRLFQVMIRSLDQDTRSNYGAGLLRFTQFCNSISVPETQRMPASEALLAQFVAAFAGITASKTLNNWMAGLQFWHIVNGAPWNASAMVHHTRRGFSKMVPSSARRAKRPPITIEALSILFDNLSFADPFDCAVGALTFTAFWCCCRLGELVIPSPNLFDPLKHVSRSALPLAVFVLPNSSHAAALHIPWTKTTKEEGATISITARPHCTCPLAALEQHTLVNANVPANAPLFSYRTSTGWSPMTRQDFISRCNNVWTSQGFPPMPGHAFRIGGATELLLQGVHPDVVSSQGRWTSRSFLEYWCRIETILPLFISSSINNEHIANVDTIMDSYAQQQRPSRSAPAA